MVPTTKTILIATAVVGGSIWAIARIYKHLREKKKIIQPLHLRASQTNDRENPIVLNDTSNIFEKELDIPTYKGLYLVKYSKTTLRKFEVYSGARLHAEISSYNKNANNLNDSVTSRSQLKIVGNQSQVYMAESYLNEILSKISYKIIVISTNRYNKLKQARRLNIPKLESITRTLIKSNAEQTYNKTADGYNLSSHDNNQNVVTFYIVGIRKDVLNAVQKIDGNYSMAHAKQSTPTDKKSTNSIANEFAEECHEITKDIWSEISQSNSTQIANTTPASASYLPSRSSSSLKRSSANVNSSKTSANVNSSSSNKTSANVNSSGSNKTSANVNSSGSNKTSANVNSSGSNKTSANVNSSSSNKTSANVNSSSSNKTSANVNSSSSNKTSANVNSSSSNKTSPNVNSSGSNHTSANVNSSSSNKTSPNVNSSSSNKTSANAHSSGSNHTSANVNSIKESPTKSFKVDSSLINVNKKGNKHSLKITESTTRSAAKNRRAAKKKNDTV